MTHTGAPTGFAIAGCTLDRLGVARCEDLSTLVETLNCFMSGTSSSSAVFLMGTGGDIAMTADLSKGLDLELPPPADEIKENTTERGRAVVIDNPLDFKLQPGLNFAEGRGLSPHWSPLFNELLDA